MRTGHTVLVIIRDLYYRRNKLTISIACCLQFLALSKACSCTEFLEFSVTESPFFFSHLARPSADGVKSFFFGSRYSHNLVSGLYLKERVTHSVLGGRRQLWRHPWPLGDHGLCHPAVVPVNVPLRACCCLNFTGGAPRAVTLPCARTGVTISRQPCSCVLMGLATLTDGVPTQTGKRRRQE